ncbi:MULTISPECIES: hypothetical protein [unclassified Bradyrhizobium]|uniref:hypothetical protein n=1 Tax=unclassified Bradyrhizobium TaxID=2631580 RepID=UPI0028E22B32|nr:MULTISPECIES: hypothetical protein [unclassified Bradyrhizobium]
MSEEEFKVGIGVRIVPAGIEKGYIRAALILAPVASTNTSCGTTVDIRYWPQQIEDILTKSATPADVDDLAVGGDSVIATEFSGVSAHFDTVGPRRNGSASAPAFRAMLHDARRVAGKTIKLKDWQRSRGNQMEQISAMWSQLVAPGKDQDWKTIVAALTESGASKAIDKFRPPDPIDPSPPPDIRGLGRGQAALLLSLERGRSLLTRTKKWLGQESCNGRDDECNLAVPAVPQLSAYLTDRERVRAVGLGRLDEEESEAKRAFEQMQRADRDRRVKQLNDEGPPSYLTQAERARAIGATRLAEEEAEARRAFERMNPVDRAWREQLLLAERMPSYLKESERDDALKKAKTDGLRPLDVLSQKETEQRRLFEQMNPSDRAKRWAEMLIDLRAREAHQAQADIRRRLENLKGATSKGKLAAAYESLLACTERTSVAACVMAVSAESAKDLQQAIADSLGQHRDALHEDDEIKEKPDKPSDNKRKENYDNDQKEKAPQMRLSALQNQPSLARVFNLVVDVLIPLQEEDIKQSATAYVARRGSPGYVRFGFLTASLKCREAKRRVWTASKLRFKSDPGTPIDDIWPCTRTELDLFWAMSEFKQRTKRDKLIARGALTQIDGFLNLSAEQTQDGVSEPRFDVISLDAPAAVENRETQKTGTKEGRPPLLTQRTAGLAVIDLWRDSSALMQALNSLHREKSSDDPTIDADDLTIGYRMDVGVVDKEKMAWRSLCNRYIEFGDDNHSVEPLLADIVPDKADRLAYDSAIVVMPVLVKDRTPPDKGVRDKTKIAFVEDTVGHWMGPPIGVDTNSVTIDLMKSPTALQLGHVYSLSPPDKPLPQELRIPKQIFGGGYFFKLAPRYHGGIIRRGSAASAEQAKYAVLPSPEAGARRFLRHERIESPIVTTPLPILSRLFDGVVDGLRETASHVTVRSKAKKSERKEFEVLDGVKSSYRVVVPPSVPADFADRHRVFANTKLEPFTDCDGKEWLGPADGLTGIDYDQRAGGFPVYGFSANSTGGLEKITNPQAKPTGDAVFSPRQKKSKRREPYYPDPAASFIVIALRDLAGRMLPGDPLVVPVRPNGVKFPEVRPIAIEIVAETTRSGAAATHQRILGLVSDKGLLRGAVCANDTKLVPSTVNLDGGATIGSGTVAASHVKVALEPGESFELDVWCAPSVEQLLNWFDAVESAALVASIDPSTGQSCVSCKGLVKQLELNQLGDIAALARKLGRSRMAEATICGGGQQKLLSIALHCMATYAHQLLLAQPTPELAARSSMTVTHAIPQVYADPAVQLSLRRVAAKPAEAPQPGAPAPAKQPQTVMVDGTVTVDRPTTGLIEIRAEATSLVSCAFDDDQRRRRTPDEVSRGIWPVSPISNEHMKVRDVYGFDVASDGQVTFTPEQATLLRVEDDIAAPSEDAQARAARNLADLREAPGAKDNPGGNVPHANAPFKIGDTRARIMRVWAVAGSRTAACFRDAKGDVQDIAIADCKSGRQEIVLPSTEAPAKVAPLTILPAFHLEQTIARDGTKHTFTVKRRVRLRVRMRRPWFTSGEGERLGIIMWPPEILRGRVSTRDNTVRRDYDLASSANADIEMKQFRDEDLGPGGSFVTRWGLDPTKEGGKLGWITPPSAFADLAQAEIDCGIASRVRKADPMYVPRASIPIPIDDGTGPRRRVWMEAALLTFVPRFDIDHETWFCDVEFHADTAPEPFMRLGLVRYQPYAPPELRVSEPVVEWLQIPQHRAVTVTVDESRPKQLGVEMKGTWFDQQMPAEADLHDIRSWTNGSVMKVSVLRRRKDGVETIADQDPKIVANGHSGKAERTWLPQTQEELTWYFRRADEPTEAKEGKDNKVGWCEGESADAKAEEMPKAEQATEQTAEEPAAFVRRSKSYLPVKGKVSQDGAHVSWRADFALNDPPLTPDEVGTSYRVLVEEVQPMFPATYDDEPLEACKRGDEIPKRRIQLIASGPRFAALLDIKASSKPPERPAVKKPPPKDRLKRLRKKQLPQPPSYGASSDHFG